MISANKSNAAPPKVAKLALFAGLVWLLAPLAASAEPSARPNIVIVYADDMGYGDLGIQNPDSKIPTPHLDRLAREGMRFTDAHSSAAGLQSQPFALLTGSFHWRRLDDIVQLLWAAGVRSDRFHAPPDAQSRRLPHRLHRQVALGLGLGGDQESKRGASGPENRLCRRCLRLVEADSRRPARPRIRLLLRQRRAELSALHLVRK